MSDTYNQPTLSASALFGCDEGHLCLVEGNIQLHSELLAPWKALVAAARAKGFDLAIASGFRSFVRQGGIWNAKLSGQRPVLDDNSCPIEIGSLSPLEKVHRVMRWSALPGASRHHWGTDMDIYDRGAVSADYVLQLVPEEYEGAGPFAPMMIWLRKYLGEQPASGFFFPYQQDSGGVMPEPWHLSYRPLADRFQQQWSLAGLRVLIENSDLLEKNTILAHLDSLYHRYIAGSINPQHTV